MNRLRPVLVAVGACLCQAATVLAGQDGVTERAGVVSKNAPIPCTTSYSAELPVLARVQGTAFFRTLVAFANNTNKNGVVASYQFSYTCLAAACSPVGGFYRTAVQSITLKALDSFSQDDFIQYLFTLGLLQPGAEQGTIGTLLVTFTNLPSCNGYEANVIARTYNRLNESDATQGTVGFAYNGSLFFDSADTTLVGLAQDTKSKPSLAGKLRANVGIRNTDINSTGQNMTVDLTFYDTATGTKVGNTITFADLRPGELRQVSDLWTAAAIPSSVNSVIVFADSRNPTATSPTMEGFINIVEGFVTQDAAFFTMICMDANGCGN
jgi:hypothetical protein